MQIEEIEETNQQKARKVEQTLFTEYEKIYKKIRRDQDFLYNTNIYQKYYPLVAATTRKHIETVHREGMEYVGKKLKQEVFFTETDIDRIKVQTEFTTSLFFKIINKDIELMLLSLIENQQLKGASNIEDTFSGILAALKRIVISAVTIAYSSSILSKTNQLPYGLSFTQTQTNTRKVRWVTRADERVCPICMQYHNKIFYVSQQATIPIPGTLGTFGSHPNCRCYYELIG